MQLEFPRRTLLGNSVNKRAATIPPIILLGNSVNKGLEGLPLHNTPARAAGRLHTAGKHKYGDYRYPQQPHQGSQKRE